MLEIVGLLNSDDDEFEADERGDMDEEIDWVDEIVLVLSGNMSLLFELADSIDDLLLFGKVRSSASLVGEVTLGDDEEDNKFCKFKALEWDELMLFVLNVSCFLLLWFSDTLLIDSFLFLVDKSSSGDIWKDTFVEIGLVHAEDEGDDVAVVTDDEDTCDFKSLLYEFMPANGGNLSWFK